MIANAVHIALASDRRGVAGLAVAVHSAVKHCSGPVCVWVVHSGLDRAMQRELEASWQRAGALAGVHFVPQSALPIALPSWWARANWPSLAAARFQLPDILPPEVSRCIYLDIDILVGTDLAELYGLDLAGHPVAMARATELAGEQNHAYIRSLGLTPETYCNSGVMLMDLGVWRSERAGARLMELGQRMRPDLWFFDQDMLNTYFMGRCATLDARWNFRDASVLPDGLVQHFAGSPKPWQVAELDAKGEGVKAWHRASRETGFEPSEPGTIANVHKSISDWLASLQRLVRRLR